MRIVPSTCVVLAVGLAPIAWTAAVWLSDILTRGSIWDVDAVWGVVIDGWVAVPILLVGLGKLAFDNRPSRNPD